MRSFIFGSLLVLGFAAGANTNGGGVFAVQTSLAEQSYVFKVGQTHDSVVFAEGRYLEGEWKVKGKSIRDQDLRNDHGLLDAIGKSSQTGQWAPIFR